MFKYDEDLEQLPYEQLLQSFDISRSFLRAVRNTVNNKKTHTPCFSTLRFSRISPEPLELQKIYLHLFILVFEELSAETRIFQI